MQFPAFDVQIAYSLFIKRSERLESKFQQRNILCKVLIAHYGHPKLFFDRDGATKADFLKLVVNRANPTLTLVSPHLERLARCR